MKVAEANGRDANKEIERLRKELEELRVGFATQKELENEYQKQVDHMFFFGYQCCMKKKTSPNTSLTILLMMKVRRLTLLLKDIEFLLQLILLPGNDIFLFFLVTFGRSWLCNRRI